VQNKIVAKIDEIIIMKRRKEQEAREIYEKARCEVEEMILGK
jgi:hypothetical protein